MKLGRKNPDTWFIFVRDWNTLGIVMMVCWGGGLIFGYAWGDVMRLQGLI